MRRTPILAALATMAALLAPTTAVAHADSDVTYNADFEDNGTTITTGNFVTDQYPFVTFDSNDVNGAGWNFGTPGNGTLASTSYVNPIVYAGEQHSGSDSGQVGGCEEFCSGHGTYGLLNYTADSLSVYAGDAAFSAPIELEAYDSSKDLIGQDDITPSTAGATNLLDVTAPAGESISYFTINQTGGVDGSNYLYIDDFTATVPASAAPGVSVTAATSSYELGRDGTINIPLTIHRINGASGDVTVNVAGFTSDVTGSASDPGTGTSSTLTVSAGPFASPGTTVPLTVSASSSGAVSEPSITIDIQVTDGILAFTGPSDLSPLTCSSKQFTVEAQLAPGEPTGPVTFSTLWQTPTTGLTASATSPGTVSNGLADTTVTLTSSGGGPGTNLLVEAKLANGVVQTDEIGIGRSLPTVTSAGPLGGNTAFTPRARGDGTTIEVYAHGLCDTATVAVGNQQATATATVEHLTGNQGAYDYLRITTPRLATTGPVTVTTGSPPATSDPSPSSITVDSYRNTDGWNFHNFDANLTWDDLVQAFGDNQTYIQVDPCAISTAGLSHCPVNVFPDPTAAAWLGIAQASLEGGTCFGMSFASQRILDGLVALSSLPGNPKNIFGAPAPNTDWSTQAVHGAQPVLDLVKSVHLMQFSTNFIGKFLGSQISASTGFTDATSIANAIDTIMSKGRNPIIQLVDGTGHILVAYDITPTGGGAYDIYVYDVNDEFASSEDGTASSTALPDGSTHQSRMTGSVIHLAADGSWSLASTTDGNNDAFHGGLANINVFDPNDLPLHPTLASASSGVNGILGMLANSSGPPNGSSSKVSSAAITQVSSGGKTLYTSGGAINGNASTRLDAAPFAPIAGSGGHAPTVGLVAVGGKVHDVTVSSTGTSAGPASMTFLQGGYVGEIDATTSSGAKQQDSFGSNSGTVGYTGTTKKPVDLKVTDSLSDSARSVDVHFGSGGTGDHVQLSGNGTLSLAHSGGATTFDLSFSGGGGKAVPGTFTTSPIHIGSGKTLKISKIGWTALDAGKMHLSVGGHTVVVRNRSRKLAAPTISRISISQKSHHRLSAKLSATVPPVPAGSRLSVIWTIRRGHRVLHTHAVDLAAKHGHLHQTWQTKATGKKLTLAATVIVFALKSTGESTSQATRSKLLKH